VGTSHGGETRFTNAVVLELEGTAQVSRREGLWDPAHTNQVLLTGDRFRTLARSRAVVQLSDLSLLRLGEFSHLRIPEASARRSGVELLRGLLYFFHRDRRGEFRCALPLATRWCLD